MLPRPRFHPDPLDQGLVPRAITGTRAACWPAQVERCPRGHFLPSRGTALWRGKGPTTAHPYRPQLHMEDPPWYRTSAVTLAAGERIPSEGRGFPELIAGGVRGKEGHSKGAGFDSCFQQAFVHALRTSDAPFLSPWLSVGTSAGEHAWPSQRGPGRLLAVLRAAPTTKDDGPR